jgi:hypothetical protein
MLKEMSGAIVFFGLVHRTSVDENADARGLAKSSLGGDSQTILQLRNLGLWSAQEVGRQFVVGVQRSVPLALRNLNGAGRRGLEKYNKLKPCNRNLSRYFFAPERFPGSSLER